MKHSPVFAGFCCWKNLQGFRNLEGLVQHTTLPHDFTVWFSRFDYFKWLSK
ncbi:MAG: hypothetical protein K9H26_08400 [Prolixibacteraceae bacterium]|nr:hypothetical protein [Prolixibacteraceae bacterium]